jgi:ankyrin repeat protein
MSYSDYLDSYSNYSDHSDYLDSYSNFSDEIMETKILDIIFNVKITEKEKLILIEDAINNGSDIEEVTRDGNTPLIIASDRGYKNIVQLLLETFVS